MCQVNMWQCTDGRRVRKSQPREVSERNCARAGFWQAPTAAERVLQLEGRNLLVVLPMRTSFPVYKLGSKIKKPITASGRRLGPEQRQEENGSRGLCGWRVRESRLTVSSSVNRVSEALPHFPSGTNHSALALGAVGQSGSTCESSTVRIRTPGPFASNSDCRSGDF